MHITLTEWKCKNFRPAPCDATVLKWNKLGLIQPPLIKVRRWMADEDAKFVDYGDRAIPASGRVADILRAA